MIPKPFITWAEDYFKDDIDKIDLQMEYDKSISIQENKTEFKKKFNSVYFNEKESYLTALSEKENHDYEENKPKEKSLEFVESLIKESLIVTIVGGRGAGKTALGFHLLEELKEIQKNKKLGFPKRHICTVGFPKKTPFPDYPNIEAVPEGSIALFDEGSMEFDARRSLSKANVYMSNQLKIARHNDLTLIWITQNSADLEVRTLRYCDILLLKKPSLIQLELERSFIKKIYESANLFESDTDWKPYYYVYSDKLKGMFQFNVPSFWSDIISKAHKKKEPEQVPSLFDKLKEKFLEG